MVINKSETCGLTIADKKTPLEYNYHVGDKFVEFLNDLKYVGWTKRNLVWTLTFAPKPTKSCAS